MGPLDHAKPASMFTDGPSILFPRMVSTNLNGPAGAWKVVLMFLNGPSSFFLRMFPTALNGPIGPCKANIDVHGWARYFPPEDVSDCFEWARQSRQSQHRCSRRGSCRDSSRLLLMGPPNHAKPASMLMDGPSSLLPRMFPSASNEPAKAWKSGIDVPEWAQ